MLAGAAVSLVVGLLVFQILTDIQKRYQDLLDRLQRIAELNHHIRNALQVIAYNNVLERTGPAIQQVSTEVARIESVLREVSAALGEHAGPPTTAIVFIADRKQKQRITRLKGTRWRSWSDLQCFFSLSWSHLDTLTRIVKNPSD